jgi:UDP-N-acetylglucosamine/UDP-N-acetylgalactosamine diphosphorylase
MDQSLRDTIRAAGQEQVLRFLGQLDPAARERLEIQLRSLDFELLDQLFRNEHEAPDWADLARRSTPPPAIRLGAADAPFSPQLARGRGEQALRDGKVAAILVAGGQGTRLGFPRPKGMFPIGPVSGHSLFQILIERVLATARTYHTSVPLFIMTSPATHDETVEYLADHHWFGLSAEDVIVFCQGTMPALDARTGQLLLAGKDSLALAPDGHGGLLAALSAHGCLDRARERGIELFSYGQIDNPLVQLCQPEMIGYHLLAESEMTSQVVRKRHPTERVGNVVMIDGKMRIIEYSDLPDDMAQRRNPDGSLFIWAGSIAVHVFNRDFLDRCSHQADALPFHVARKKVDYVDADGVLRQAEESNGIKYERFIFDLLPWARNAIVVEGDPAEVFAPVKNAEGADTDTPSATRQAMIRLHTRWLRRAGAAVGEGIAVEISPLWALDETQVVQREELPQAIDKPTFFG